MIKTILYNENLIPLTVIGISERERTMLEDGYSVQRRTIMEAMVGTPSDDIASTSPSLAYEIRPLKFKLPPIPGAKWRVDLFSLFTTVNKTSWLIAKDSPPKFLPHQSAYLREKFGIDV